LSKKEIKLGFIGAGSIGSLFGGYLAKVESAIYLPKVFFFCKRKHAEAINKKGLIIKKDQTITKIKQIKAYDNLKTYEKEGLKNQDRLFDFIFLSTKTYDIESAITEYKSVIDKSKFLVILQNGIGNEEIISKHISKGKIIRIVTSNGALLEKPGFVVHTGIGKTKIGFAFKCDVELKIGELKSEQEDISVLFELLNLAGLETIKSEDIIKDCWEKIFVNVGINAFGALTRLKNGQLLQNDHLKDFMGEAVKEAIEVAKAKKIDLSEEDFIALTYDVAIKTSENKNSMLQDVLKKKNTEIDFINGRILKYAEEIGINVPINATLTYLIKGLEQSFK